MLVRAYRCSWIILFGLPLFWSWCIFLLLWFTCSFLCFPILSLIIPRVTGLVVWALYSLYFMFSEILFYLGIYFHVGAYVLLWFPIYNLRTYRHHTYEKNGGPKSIELKEIGPRFEMILYKVSTLSIRFIVIARNLWSHTLHFKIHMVELMFTAF